MIKQKEKKILNKLFEAVELLQKYIDKSEAIKRVFILYIVLGGLFKFKRTGPLKRLSHKGKLRRVKSEPTQIPQFLTSIDHILREASPPIANKLKIRKYVSGIPTETLWELFSIILLMPRCSQKEMAGVISAFYLSPNIRELLGNRKSKATPDCVGKLAVKILGLDNYGSDVDIFHSIDESLYPGFGYEHIVDLLLDALDCSEKEKVVIFDLAMVVAGVDNNWQTYYTKPPEDDKPSKVFCNPIDSEDFDTENSSGSYYQDYFSKAINDHLDSFTWQMGIVVPLTNLSEDGKVKNVLKSLLSKDWIEAVIELPEMLFSPRTQIITALVILNKQKGENRKSKVAFVRSGYRQKDNYVDIPKREITKLKKLLQRFRSDWKQIAIISENEINRANNNLLPSFYIDSLQRELESLKNNKSGVPLESVAMIVQGGVDTITLEQNEYIPLVTAKDLHPEKAKILDKVTNKLRLDIPKTEISEKCVLISLRHESLKPTTYETVVSVFSPTHETLFKAYAIYINKGVIALIPKMGVIDIKYLYFQFYSDLTVRQIQSILYQSPKKRTNLKLEDLKSLIVRVPKSLEEQLEIVEKEKRILIDEECLKQQREIIALKKRLNVTEIKQEAESKIVGHLVHEIKNTKALIDGPIDRVNKFLESKCMLDEAIIKNKDGTEEKVKDALGQALEKLELIKNILDGTEKLIDLKIDRTEFAKVNICDVFKHDIEPLCSGEQFVIRVVCGAQNEVFMYRPFFVLAMQNIIKNAKMHGFQKNQTDGEIRFDITERSEHVVIDYTNNGRKFPDNMSIKDFLTLGKKAETSPGGGYGGALIGKVIDAHNGVFEIIRDDNPVHFKITLPKEG